ncbi:MAG: hypothetical protein E7658_02900 [Ruminococcaceae bacterium]|nr:hypothetical protein [Oscillospiraceae bacterium]
MKHSPCHGWACGPVPFLTYVVGVIEILEPGCTKIRIMPRLGGLGYVEVRYPTPHGILRVVHTRMDDGSVKTDVDAPDGVCIVE